MSVWFQINITTFLESYHLGHSTLLTTLSFVSGTVAKFLIGLLSDLTVHRVPRAALILATTAVQVNTDITRSLTDSLTDSPTDSLTHSLTHSLTDSLTDSLTH